MRYLFLFIAFNIFYSCSKKDNKNNDLASRNLKGRVKSVREVSFVGIDELGEIKRGKIKAPGTLFLYNEDGNLTKVTHFYLHSIDIYDYNDKRLLKGISNYNTDMNGAARWNTVYQYDGNGSLSAIVTYNKKGTISSKVESKYNDDKLLIEETDTYYNDKNDGSSWEIDGQYFSLVSGIIKYQYNRNGKVEEEMIVHKCLDTTTSSIIYDTSILTHTYNDEGKEIAKYKKFRNGLFEKTVYSYDKNGLVVLKVYSNNIDKSHINYIDDIPYYFNGGENESSNTEEVKYSYNVNGEIEEQETLVNGHVRILDKYEYDKHGNAIRHVNNDGLEINVDDREIFYYGESERESQLTKNP